MISPLLIPAPPSPPAPPSFPRKRESSVFATVMLCDERRWVPAFAGTTMLGIIPDISVAEPGLALLWGQGHNISPGGFPAGA
jgi:hypothetical protein